MSAPSKMAWSRWAREMAAEHELMSREAHLLLVLATIGDNTGQGFATAGDLATYLVCTERHAARLFKQLRNRGLVIRLGHPNGRLRWRLNSARRPAAQLSLVAPDSDIQVSDSSNAQMSGSDTGMSDSSDIQMSGGVGHSDVRHKDPKGQRTTGGERGRAHEQHLDWGSLQPHLRRVLEVLEDAPELVVSDAAVNSALAAHPEPRYDHMRAAHTVAAWAYEDGLAAGVASFLLKKAFEHQDRAGRRGQQRGDGAAHRAANGRRGDDPEATARLRELRVALAKARGEEVEA